MNDSQKYNFLMAFKSNQKMIENLDKEIHEIEIEMENDPDCILSDETTAFYTDEGEKLEALTIFVNGRNFHKVCLEQMLAVLHVIGNAETRVFAYILSNTNYDADSPDTKNTFTASIDQIRKATHSDKGVVSRMIKKLITGNYLTKTGPKTYRLNPNLISTGRVLQQQHVMQLFEKEKIQNLKDYKEKQDNKNKVSKELKKTAEDIENKKD